MLSFKALSDCLLFCIAMLRRVCEFVGAVTLFAFWSLAYVQFGGGTNAICVWVVEKTKELVIFFDLVPYCFSGWLSWRPYWLSLWHWSDFRQFLTHTNPVVVISLVTCAVLVLLGRSMILRVVQNQRLRSSCVGFESMQEGSAFVKGDIPGFQVEILKPGVLFDTFVGYGIRLLDVLVVPTHVVRAAGGRPIMKTEFGKYVVEGAPVESRVHADTSYYNVKSEVWAILRVLRAAVPKRVVNAFVQVAGKPGVSSGTMTPTSTCGVFVYSGSTLPGMSGAAYYASNIVHGVHTGVSSQNKNLGVSALMLAMEIKRLGLVMGEAAIDIDYVSENTSKQTMKDVAAQIGKLTDVRKGWDVKAFQQRVDDAFQQEQDYGWAADDDLDFDQDVKFDAAESECRDLLKKISDLSSSQREKMVSYAQGLVSSAATFPRSIDVTGQSDDPSRVKLTDPCWERYDVLRKETVSAYDKLYDWAQEIDARVAVLEEKLPRKGVPPPVLRRFKCPAPDCKFGSKTKLGLAAHAMAKGHPLDAVAERPTAPVQGESAIPANSERVIKEKPFLEKRPPLPRGKPGSSTNTSTTRVMNQGPTPAVAIQNLCQSLAEMTARLQKTLEEYPLVMGGPTSAATPSAGRS